MEPTALKAGFARAEITPPLGVPIAGYFVPRRATGVLDPLEASCLALSDGASTALLLALDLLGIKNVCLCILVLDLFKILVLEKCRIRLVFAVLVSGKDLGVGSDDRNSGKVPVYGKTGTCRDEASDDDVLLKTDQVIDLTLDGSIRENLGCLLEGCS